MRWFLGVIGTIHGSSIECPLLASSVDDLITVAVRGDDGATLQLIVDTGAAGVVLFSQEASPSIDHAVTFQGANIGHLRHHNRGLTLLCAPQLPVGASSALEGDPQPSDLRNVADGILGLGGRGFTTNPSFLFSSEAPKWSEVTIHVFENGGGHLSFRLEQVPEIRGIPTVSNYYWAVALTGIRIGSTHVPSSDHQAGTIVIFDTGSNFFGASSRLFASLIQAIGESNCNEPLTLVLALSEEITFPAKSLTLEDGKCDKLAIAQVDQSRFGDVADRQVIIVGTRGLRGKSISLIKGTSKAGQSVYLHLS